MNTATLPMKTGKGENAYFDDDSSDVFSCIRASASIHTKTSSSRMVSGMDWFCAGRYFDSVGYDFNEDSTEIRHEPQNM